MERDERQQGQELAQQGLRVDTEPEHAAEGFWLTRAWPMAALRGPSPRASTGYPESHPWVSHPQNRHLQSNISSLTHGSSRQSSHLPPGCCYPNRLHLAPSTRQGIQTAPGKSSPWI